MINKLSLYLIWGEISFFKLPPQERIISAIGWKVLINECLMRKASHTINIYLKKPNIVKVIMY